MTLHELNAGIQAELPNTGLGGDVDLTGLKPGDVTFTLLDGERLSLKILDPSKGPKFQNRTQIGSNRYVYVTLIMFDFTRYRGRSPENPRISVLLAGIEQFGYNVLLPRWVKSKVKMLGMRRQREIRRINDIGPRHDHWTPSDQDRFEWDGR